MSPEDKIVLDEASYRMLLTGIPRWTIVEMMRPQSVAEHSFRVRILALSLYDYMQQGTPHNSFDRESISNWATDHDMDEIESGDIPTPFKEALNKLFDGATVKIKEELMTKKLPSYVGTMRGVQGSYPYDVVKIADNVETLLYVRTYGVGPRAPAAAMYVLQVLAKSFVKAREAHPRYDWNRAREWLEYFVPDHGVAP